MKFQIKVDGRLVPIWRHVPRTRATGYRTRDHYEQSGFYGGHFHPRRLGPSGVSLEITGRQSGFELWGEDEKLMVWPADGTVFANVTAIDTVANCITTKAGISVPAEITRTPLSAEEYEAVRQERLIAAQSHGRARQTLERQSRRKAVACPVCAWQHDTNFTRITIPGSREIVLRGVMSEIVACVHEAHARGLAHLDIKDDRLLRKCGGYRHPCKAFDDLGESKAYQALFDTSRRSYLALRGWRRKESE
jgi:hypothetical protein